MARPINTLPIPADDGFNPQRLEQAGLAAQELAVMHSEQDARVRAVATQLGYLLPADCTDPDLIQRDIASNMRRSVEACLEVGRGLGVLKAACGHGNFMVRLDVLGIDDRVARKFMQAASRVSNRSSTAVLAKALGNQTKLFEMLVLDDEQLEELELTGQTGELKLDDVASMSIKELRAAVREARKTIDAKARVVADKESTISKLQEQLAQGKAGPAGDGGQSAENEIAAATDDALEAVHEQVREISTLIISALRSEFVQLSKPALMLGDTLRRQAIGASIGRIIAVTRKLAQDFDIPVSGPAAVEIDEDAQWDEIWAAALRDFDVGQKRVEESTGHGDVSKD